MMTRAPESTGQSAQVAGEGSFDGQDCTAGDQADDADPAHDDSRLFGRLPFEGEHRQQGADGEFPQAGAGVEVGESLVGVGFDDGEGQGCDKHRVEDDTAVVKRFPRNRRTT